MKTSAYTEERIPEVVSFVQDCLDLFKNLSIPSLLLQIARIASQHTNASYCVCGIHSERRGHFDQFQIYGLSQLEMGLLRQSAEPIRAIPLEESFREKGMIDCQKEPVFTTQYPRIHSQLFVPILGEDFVLGSISLLNKIGGAEFTEADLSMMESLSVYAGIAINNARLYSQGAEREHRLEKQMDSLGLLNELGRIFANSDGNGQHLIRDMMNMIMGTLNMEIGEFFLNLEDEPDAYRLCFSAGHSGNGSIFGFDLFEKGDGLVGEAAENETPYLLKKEELETINRENDLPSGLNYLVTVPAGTNNGTLGVMVLGTNLRQKEEPPDLSFLSSIAAWIAPLIENLRMIDARQKLAILEERERIGMDLHDGVIQSIYGVGLVLENARLTAEEGEPQKTASTIRIAIEELNATIKDIRSYIMNLKPQKLTHENILQSLARLANDFHTNTLVPADFSHSVEHVEGLSDEKVNVFYMICKEALSNIAKHAHASKVTIDFTEMEDRFVLIVQDNGDGFDTSVDPGETHHGIGNMANRARNLGGDMDISSIIGHGTTVIVWLPWSAPEKG